MLAGDDPKRRNRYFKATYYGADGKPIHEETYLLKRIFGIGETFFRWSRTVKVLDVVIIDNMIHYRTDA